MTVTEPPPTLGLVFGAGAWTFTRPAAAMGFVLQETDSLSAPIHWTTVTVFPVIINDLHTGTIEPSGEGARFYRLCRAAE